MKKVLGFAGLYRLYHFLLGTSRMRRFYIEKFVVPQIGCRIIDIGCGPGDIVEFLPAVEYTGVDYNPRYIEAAAARFGRRAKFMVGRVGDDLATLLTPADL